ncbi:MAG: ribonuclease P protein component [Spirochaetia bacterium]|nr:ribonuclease P protein component [Spirochaetia bacterium]
MKQKQLFTSLKLKKNIKQVFNDGIPVKSKYINAKFLTAESPSFSAMNILWAVPKKIKSSVLRNRLKRVAKAALFNSLKDKEDYNLEKTGLQIAVILRPEFENLPFEKRVLEFDFLINQILSKKKIFAKE